MALNSITEKIANLIKNKVASGANSKLAERKFYVVGFMVLGIIALSQSCSSNEPEATQPPSESERFSADTYIPSGMVLVPIEISNAESLEGLIGDVGGVVDLFTTNQEGNRKSFKVGERLKLLKAPLNPRQFAVLVDEESSGQILQHQGPFFAIIQNPQQKNGNIKKQFVPKKNRNIEIYYPQVGGL